jgi:hypothetical protein
VFFTPTLPGHGIREGSKMIILYIMEISNRMELPSCWFLVATLSLIHYDLHTLVMKLSTCHTSLHLSHHPITIIKLHATPGRQTIKNSVQHNIYMYLHICSLCSALWRKLGEHLLLHPDLVPFFRIFISN